MQARYSNSLLLWRMWPVTSHMEVVQLTFTLRGEINKEPVVMLQNRGGSSGPDFPIIFAHQDESWTRIETRIGGFNREFYSGLDFWSICSSVSKTSMHRTCARAFRQVSPFSGKFTISLTDASSYAGASKCVRMQNIVWDGSGRVGDFWFLADNLKFDPNPIFFIEWLSIWMDTWQIKCLKNKLLTRLSASWFESNII